MSEITKKRILFYINAISFGGSGRVLTNLANQFSKEKYDVIFVTTCKYENEYSLEQNIKRIIIEPKTKKGKIFKNISRIFKLRNVIKCYKPEVTISFLPESNFRLLLATKGIKTRTVVSVRNDPKQEYKGFFSKMLAKILYRKANVIVFQSEEQKVFFSKSIQQKSSVIPNQIHPIFFVDEENKKKDIILSVGRIEKSKNQALIINAFNDIRTLFSTYELHIYGDGSERNNLLKLVSNLQAENQIKLFASTNDIINKYREAKIFVSTSNFEGMPNVLIEAMAMGLPVITTDASPGGPRIITGNGEYGLLIPVEDKEALKEKLLLLLENDKLRILMGKKAKLAVKNYNPDVVFKQWEDKLII